MNIEIRKDFQPIEEIFKLNKHGQIFYNIIGRITNYFISIFILIRL